MNYLTVKKVHQITGIAKQTIRNDLKSGVLKGKIIKTSGKYNNYVVDANDVDRWFTLYHTKRPYITYISLTEKQRDILFKLLQSNETNSTCVGRILIEYDKLREGEK